MKNLPSIEYDWWEKINEEKIFIELKYTGAFPAWSKQNNSPGA